MADMPHDTDSPYPIRIRAFFEITNFDTDLRQIMENIFLRYFWMCSERRTVLSSI